jgi:hypothetical protein
MRSSTVRFLLLTFTTAIAAGGCATGASDGAPNTYDSWEACAASVPSPDIEALGGGSSIVDVGTGLRPADVGAINAQLRQATIAQMRADVAQSRRQAIVDLRCSGMGLYAPQPVISPQSDQPPQQVSGTNNQTPGVDEADFLKNDSGYLYLASGSTARIIAAWPAESAHEIARVTVPGRARKLLVAGDRLLVFSAVVPNTNDPASETSECTYGYDCSFAGDGSHTVLSLFDMSDRSAPALVRQIRATSSLLAARQIGTAAHVVLSTAATPWGGGSYYSTYPTTNSAAASEADINRQFDDLVAENERRIATIEVNPALPQLQDSSAATAQRSVLVSPLATTSHFVSVLSLDMVADGPAREISVLSDPGAVYASTDALYVAASRSSYASSKADFTSIHKFAVSGVASDTEYRASGGVKGRVLSQFSMDDRDGFLRVATSTGHLPDPTTHSTLSVLEQHGAVLTVAGQIDQIAPSEDIRSVRFEGDRGYVVTFKKTDPLFVFDLHDPHAPGVMGELKIPGFSTYMHMMDATHLLTIGYDADDKGSYAFFNGILLQVFDVSNPAQPALAHRETIGTRGSSSDALTDHFALNYFAPKNLLALPATICDGGGNGVYGTLSFTGLLVYDVTADAGFSLRGKVAHPADDTSCGTWWSEATSDVKRSVIMDDYLFSVSDERIKVNSLSALGTDLTTITLE